MIKASDGNYPCPDVFDLTDGAMWNNKLDNILVYHRPFAQTDPSNPSCEFHSKKIRRQKILDMNFKDFVGLPEKITDRTNNSKKEFKLPIPRPKNSTRDQHPLRKDN